MAFDPAAIITSDRLKALAVGHPATLAEDVAPYLAKHAASFGITTPLRCAHLVAQLCYESAYLGRLSENLNYSAERIREIFPKFASRAEELAHRPEGLANAVYANRFGNRDEVSGDGHRYRGRGLIMVTFRDNYREIGVALGTDMIGSPNLLMDPEWAARAALVYWSRHGCNDPADLDDVAGVTKIINGGAHGLTERRALTDAAKAIFVTHTTDLIA